MPQEKSSPLPVNIQLPEQQLLGGSVMFVTLETLEKLEAFWKSNEGRFNYACQGSKVANPIYLREHEWVFAASKSDVIRTVMRWEKMGVSCEFYDWSKDDNAGWLDLFRDRDTYRAAQIKRGFWTHTDESEYLKDCRLRSPDTYKGFWQIKSPVSTSHALDYFDLFEDELTDASMPIEGVERTLQEQAFNYLSELSSEEILCHDRKSIRELIDCWRHEESKERDLGKKELATQ